MSLHLTPITRDSKRYEIGNSVEVYKKKIFYRDNNGERVNIEDMNPDYQIYEENKIPRDIDENTGYYVLHEENVGITKTVKKYIMDTNVIETKRLKEYFTSQNIIDTTVEKYLKYKEEDTRNFILSQIYSKIMIVMYKNGKACDSLELYSFHLELSGDKLLIYYMGKITKVNDIISSFVRNYAEIGYINIPNHETDLKELIKFFSDSELYIYFFINKFSNVTKIHEVDVFKFFFCHSIHYTLRRILQITKKQNPLTFIYNSFGWCYDLMEYIRPSVTNPVLNIKYQLIRTLPISNKLYNIINSIGNNSINKKAIQMLKKQAEERQNYKHSDGLFTKRRVNSNVRRNILTFKRSILKNKQNDRMLSRQTSTNDNSFIFQHSNSFQPNTLRKTNSDNQDVTKKRTKKNVRFNTDVSEYIYPTSSELEVSQIPDDNDEIINIPRSVSSRHL